LNSDELFDSLPEIIFGSLRKQMLLGVIPARTVSEILEPLLRNFHEIMPRLSPDLREDFENILRIYPDVASRFNLRVKPPLIEALKSLVSFFSVSTEIPGQDDAVETKVEFDLAAEEQHRFKPKDTVSFREGQGFFSTDRGNSVYLEFTWSAGDDFIAFSHKPSQMEADLYIFGSFAVPLGPTALEKKVEIHRLLEIFSSGVSSAEPFRLVERTKQ
jgi:hypothetical protein